MTNPPPPPGGYPPPPGNFPPQQGGFQSPQQGGYPPPPGGGFQPQQGGFQPPPPPGGGFPPQQGGYPPPAPGGPGYPPGGPGFGVGPGPGGGYSIGDAFTWAWNKFTKHPAELIVPTLAFGAIYFVVQLISQLFGGVFGSLASSSSSSTDLSASYTLGTAGTVVSLLGGLVMLVITAVIQSAYLGGMLDLANGAPVTIGSFFRPRNVGNVIVASLVVGAIMFVAALVLFVPGFFMPAFIFIGFPVFFIVAVIIGVLFLFATVAAVDHNLSGIAAVQTSFALAKANFGVVFLTALVMMALTIAGMVACGIGLLVAYPVSVLIEVYAWRRLTNGPLAPLTP